MEKIKITFTAVFTAIFSALGILAVPVLLLLGANIFDYITALTAAPSRGQNIKSELSFAGICKKVHMYILILLGLVVDVLLGTVMGALSLDQVINLDFAGTEIKFLIATVIAVWLLFNELISILENISDAGTKIPPFLMPLLKRIKGEIEAKTNIEED